MRRAGLRVLLASTATVASGVIGIQTPAQAADSTAATLLAELPISSEGTATYSRDYFEHWIDADGDGCDTRQEVLIEESQTEPTVGAGCTVAGQWTSWYDQVAYTDPTQLDIDHMVPLEEAWQSGASSWTSPTRRDYANDLTLAVSLVAVTDNVNQSKGSRDPAQWLPPAAAAHCTYAVDWILVKYRWSLAVDPAERTALNSLLTGGCGDTVVAVPPVADVSMAATDSMAGGQEITSGGVLTSSNGDYRLVAQDDGNLVIYASDGRAIWSSGTWGNVGARLIMQTDGNLVLYTASGRPTWSSNTWGNPGSWLVLQDDGNLVIYRANGTPIFATGADRGAPPPISVPAGDTITGGQQLGGGQRLSSASGYFLEVQGDGNIVTYTPGGSRALWSTGTPWATNARLVMQTDGNLVLYTPNGTVAWTSNTWGNPGSRLVIQGDGNLVLYRANGSPAWSTGPDRGIAPPPVNPTPGTDPRYGTCTEAKSHGYGPYYRGIDTEYAWYRDSDSDGIVCE